MSAIPSSASSPARAWPRAIALLGLLPLVFVGPALLPGKRFLPALPLAFEPLASEHGELGRAAAASADPAAADRALAALADDHAIARAWRAGSVPSWDPDTGLGRPLAATARDGAWYPPNALKLVLGPDVAAGWLALLALFLAGLGMHLFLGVRGRSALARAAGAWAAQSGSFALVHAHERGTLDAALWLPFALWAVEGLLTKRPRAGPALAGSIALAGLAGDATVALLVLGLTLVYAAWRGLAVGPLPVLRVLGLWIAVGVLGAAVQVLPAREARADSSRPAASADEIASSSLPPAALMTLVQPDVFGAPSDRFVAPHNPWAWAWTSRADSLRAEAAEGRAWCLHAGVAVLLLACVAIAGRFAEAWMPSVLVLLVLGFVLGWPIASLAYAVPGLESDAAARGAAILWILFPWLAAIGFDAWLERARFTRSVVTASALALLAVGAIEYFGFRPEAFAASLPEILAERHGVTLDVALEVVPRESALLAGERLRDEGLRLAWVALGALACALVSRFVRGDRGFVRAAPWLALVVFEGAWVARVHLVPQDLGAVALHPPSNALEAVREVARDGRVVRWDTSPTRTSDVERLARPGLLQPYGIRDLSAAAPATTKSLAELVHAADPTSLRGARVTRVSDRKALGARILDLARVTCVLARETITDPRLAERAAIGAFHVLARSGAFPAARVVPAELSIASGDEAALALLAEEAVDLRVGAVAVAGDLPPESERPRGATDPFRSGTIEVDEPAPDRLDARVTASSGGWLVFHAQWAPGWKATVNGVDAPVVRVDHVCRAVPIPPGDAIVRTKYEPGALRLGAALTLVALSIGLIATFRARPATSAAST